MINIKRGSTAYRLALYGVFFEDYKIHDNLCPFMRQIVWGAGLALCYSLIIALLLMVALTPLVQIFHSFNDGWAFEWNSAMVVGTVLWAMVLLISLVVLYFADDGSIAKTFVDKQLENIDLPEWLIVQWMVALHQRICPKLNFEGDTKDGHLLESED
jgi:uncharacterized membrane protein